MGAFYGSVQVRSDRREPVMAAAEEVARQRGCRCLVGPLIGAWVGIYPEEHGQDHSFGEALATKLTGDVLHLIVHDEGVMAYWYWREGRLVDSFWSVPGYFDESDAAEQEKMCGRPAALSHLAPGKARVLGDLLKRGTGEFVFESERLQKLAEVLGIANATTAYEYLKSGDTEDIQQWDQFKEIPRRRVARERKAKQARRCESDAQVQDLKDKGLLLVHEEHKGLIARAARARDGFVVVWEGIGAGPRRVERYAPPWQAAELVQVDTSPQINDVSSDAAGSQIAMSLGSRIVVWDAATWRPVAEFPERDWAIKVALSPDGRLLAHSSREEIGVSEIASRRRVVTCTGTCHESIALHLTGKWIVATGLTLAVAPLGENDAGQWRRLFIGGKSEAPQAIATLLQGQMPKMDLEAMKGRMQAAQEAMLKKLRAAGIPFDEAAMQKQADEQMAAMAASLAKMSRGEPISPPKGNERPTAVGFSADGEWLWSGTDKGLRVYPWAEVLAAGGEDMPPARWRYDTKPDGETGLAGHVHAISEEPGGFAVLFAVPTGAASAKVYRLDLKTGQARPLLALPGQGPVIGLHFSRDGDALGISSRPGMLKMGVDREDRGLWTVWAYARLTQQRSQ